MNPTIVLSLCLLTGTCLKARAGAWPVRPGAGKAVLSASFLKAGSVTDAEGDKRTFDIEETALSTFGEIGLTPSLAAGWSWSPVKSADADSFQAVSLGDPELSLSWHLKSSGALQLAAQAITAFPLGSDNPQGSPEYLYAVFSHRAFAFEIRPVAGWAGGGFWLQGGAGPRLRTSGLASQFHYNLAGGGGIGPRAAWLLAFSGVTPLDTEPAGKPGDQEQYFGYQAAVEYRFAPAWQAGLQFDSMLTLGREMPLGGRFNLFARRAWNGPRRNPVR
ncbi:MAG: hypothetical protein M3Y08_02235 [Fibrobacterota bacterium]|nr:hypothetical protein [Fibrobacterota bacterium]